jgi:hypothetical protein
LAQGDVKKAMSTTVASIVHLHSRCGSVNTGIGIFDLRPVECYA